MFKIFKRSDLHIKKSDIYALPNILTYIRILLVPVFIVVYLNSEQNLAAHLWSVIIVIFSALTDIADGFIARHFNMITDLGKILDPIADKAMQFSMLFCVVFRFPWVSLLIVIYAIKEIVSLIFSGYLFTKGKHISGAMWCGKICTVILYGVMLALIGIPAISPFVVTTLIGFSAAFMLLAFVIYMDAYLKLYREYKKDHKDDSL